MLALASQGGIVTDVSDFTFKERSFLIDAFKKLLKPKKT